MVKALLEGQVEKNPKNKENNFTPLHSAINEGQVDVCELLLQYNVDKNAKA